jgi:DNA-binding transcriptional MocR family regulator
MGKRYLQNGRSAGARRFVMLEHDLLESPAWKSLRPVERALYVAIVQRFNGFNNGDISLSCREAALDLGTGKGTISTAYGVLLKRGFIEVTKGSAFNMKTKVAARYRLTSHPVDHGNKRMPATNEWKRWKNEISQTLLQNLNHGSILIPHSTFASPKSPSND